MATSTFERRIAIENTEALDRLLQIISDDTPQKPISNNPYSSDERKRVEAILENIKHRKSIQINGNSIKNVEL